MAHYIAHFTKLAGKNFGTEEISLDELTPEHRDILKRLFYLYSQNCADFVFNFMMQNPKIMKILGCEFFIGKYWWRKEITDLPIYKILEDMSFVLSIRQGKMAHEDTSYMEENEKTLREFLQLQ